MTAAFTTGLVVGVALGALAVTIVMSAHVADLNRRIDSLLDWEDESKDWMAEIKMYERGHK